MKSKKIELTADHVKQTLQQRLLIGSDVAHNGSRKTFSFDVWANEYVIECNYIYVAGGQALEELLEQYNDL